VEEHREKGADLDVDVSYAYLQYVLEDDDLLKKIGEDYGSGKMLTGEVKKILVDELQKIIAAHQERRKKVTDDVVCHFMNPHRASLNFEK
jgi:tryptophanyl-tRNA synthetase